MSAARPAPVSPRIVRRFTRGQERPRGVVWFGAGSFWGHLRHLISAAIASENIDSRDWMAPDEPAELQARMLAILGGARAGAPTLVEGLGRDLWIDFVADTGDDVAVSRAVARLVLADYQLPDPDNPGAVLEAPRGDVLLFGGDTAYPVATAQEILNRVIVPWNQVIQALPDGGDAGRRERVLLGIPGNHDWYDGLDGFVRMFRRRPPTAPLPAPVVGVSQLMIEQHAAWAREFVRGGAVAKPEALVLAGYTPVQTASHFALRLAPDLDLLAVDRQLTNVDPQQQAFLQQQRGRGPRAATLVVLPDPVYLFGAPSKTGTKMVECVKLDLAARETFVLSGDIHHYERLRRGKALHVIAGGGGAFLHPARIAEGGLPLEAVWPGVAQSRLLLRDVPWKLACGRSGFLPHFALLLLFAPPMLLGGRLQAQAGASALEIALTTLVLGGIFALLSGVTSRKAVLPLALAAAAAVALVPLGTSLVVRAAFLRLWPPAPALLVTAATLALAAFVGAFLFGGFLALLTTGGYEHMQALTALDHPGFKHFVRLRVRADGAGVDGWCVGATDPLGAGQQPELVDCFTWRPFEERRGDSR